ncbi:uncharacterized membrane protein YjjP (DUF1212 family) [Silvimonas terrae]|uniref:Uncharacterized membrane protein YjjP (DUF1212 family) n=1 Tax=Silvimonas terrae TaxID=300266 RepID=A0A840RFQ6_9NEIS|nr:threonine/serine exporter family protein [Silvimonas terrae]MBB5191877.1 uncharacterized membrane protein YjjP (DUF1212 family) [Silvimonas terrae]
MTTDSVSPQPVHLAALTDTALHAGLIAHSCGGDTARTSEIMQRVAVALGGQRADTVVSSLNLGLTVEADGERETALRKAPHMGINFDALTHLEDIVHALETGQLDHPRFRCLLHETAARPRAWPAWQVAIMVGLACGGFAALFGGDVAAIGLTSIASTCGIALRQWLAQRHFQPLIFATAAAFVATLITGLARPLTLTPDAALAACVLFLIPGVPLINGTADLLTGNYLNGNVRLTTSVVFILGIAIGMSLALRITGS